MRVAVCPLTEQVQRMLRRGKRDFAEWPEEDKRVLRSLRDGLGAACTTGIKPDPRAISLALGIPLSRPDEFREFGDLLDAFAQFEINEQVERSVSLHRTARSDATSGHSEEGVGLPITRSVREEDAVMGDTGESREKTDGAVTDLPRETTIPPLWTAPIDPVTRLGVSAALRRMRITRMNLEILKHWAFGEGRALNVVDRWGSYMKGRSVIKELAQNAMLGQARKVYSAVAAEKAGGYIYPRVRFSLLTGAGPLERQELKFTFGTTSYYHVTGQFEVDIQRSEVRLYHNRHHVTDEMAPHGKKDFLLWVAYYADNYGVDLVPGDLHFFEIDVSWGSLPIVFDAKTWRVKTRRWPFD